MRTYFAAILLAAMPLFSQTDPACVSMEQRQAEFRAEYSNHLAGNAFNTAPSRRVSAADCLAMSQPKPDPKPAGPVSFYKLNHKVLSRAKREFDKAVIASKEGKPQEAEAHYRTAIKIDPGYVEAHNNLGARLMVRSMWRDAIEEFTLASRLDPSASSVHSNLGVVYLELKDYKRAEEEGKLASSLDPSAGKPHYVVGMAMLFQHKDSEAVKSHLRLAADEVPGVLQLIERLRL